MNKKGLVEWLIPLSIVIGAASIALGYKYFFKAADDNPVEEIAEDVIKAQIHIDLDLSPKSPER